MIGDGYILGLARASQSEISLALYQYFYSRLAGQETEDHAGKLAAAVAMTILGEPAQEHHHQAFREANGTRIADEVQKITSDNRLCEILSGAAYNIGYGRYLDKGGGRLFNTFLAFIRSLNQLDNKQALGYRLDLMKRDKTILRPIEALQKLDLWRNREHNPNESDYYKAIHQFALENNVPFK